MRRPSVNSHVNYWSSISTLLISGSLIPDILHALTVVFKDFDNLIDFMFTKPPIPSHRDRPHPNLCFIPILRCVDMDWLAQVATVKTETAALSRKTVGMSVLHRLPLQPRVMRRVEFAFAPAHGLSGPHSIDDF